MPKPQNVKFLRHPRTAAAVVDDTFKIFRQNINETDINSRQRTHGSRMHLIALS